MTISIKFGNCKIHRSAVGSTLVMHVQIGPHMGNLIGRLGINFLDFSEYHPDAIYPWPISGSMITTLVNQLNEVRGIDRSPGAG